MKKNKKFILKGIFVNKLITLKSDVFKKKIRKSLINHDFFQFFRFFHNCTWKSHFFWKKLIFGKKNSKIDIFDIFAVIFVFLKNVKKSQNHLEIRCFWGKNWKISDSWSGFFSIFQVFSELPLIIEFFSFADIEAHHPPPELLDSTGDSVRVILYYYKNKKVLYAG